jgi:deoxyribodipyrimidine photo-lyase
MSVVFWFRRDRRIADNPALLAACEKSADRAVFPIFPIDESFHNLKTLRAMSLIASLEALNEKLAGALSVKLGSVSELVLEAAKAANADTVFATRAFDTEGMLEQAAVAEKLFSHGISLHLLDSYYAVEPGTVTKDDGTAVRVYTPFYKRWLARGWEEPYAAPQGVKWKMLPGWDQIPKPVEDVPFKIRAGEDFALRTFERFRKRALRDYSENRNRADLSGTSHLSHALAHGEIHPRTLLAVLGDTQGEEVFRKEIAWREFYADVLFRNPHTLNGYYEERFSKMRYDEGAAAKAKLEAWKQGRTGYPMVDAAMRQLLTTGWMHNRSRMIVASFLVKDLHIEWTEGAKWFEENLTDYDPASNSHGWQWTAGCGTDASPYYRVFNPILQGLKFDPEGNYVRKYVPELSHIPGPEVHEPWKLIDGLAKGYPAPICDHSVERDESLRRLEEIKI